MDAFKRIPDVIIEMSEGMVVKRKLRRALPIILILFSVAMFWWGWANKGIIGYQRSSYVLMICGIAFLLVAICAMLFSRSYFVEHRTNAKLKPELYYFKPEDREEIESLFRECSLDDLLHRSIHAEENFAVEVWSLPTEKVAFVQLLMSDSKKMIPISEVKRCQIK